MVFVKAGLTRALQLQLLCLGLASRDLPGPAAPLTTLPHSRKPCAGLPTQTLEFRTRVQGTTGELGTATAAAEAAAAAAENPPSARHLGLLVQDEVRHRG